MRLEHDSHLAYCTNVHPGNDWQETFHSLKNDVLSVRANVCPKSEYAIGLRLSASAAKELSQPETFSQFRAWLDANDCYVFTINGFPYGNFHGQRVKEQVYWPDWSSQDRLDYTKLLFDLLVELLPEGVSGSVSTVPGSFKRFIDFPDQIDSIQKNLYSTYEYVDRLSEKRNRDLHLGLEPEPLCLFETTDETLVFFDRFAAKLSDAPSALRRIGVNYDTCHLALEYENAANGLSKLRDAGIRISKIHLSSALKVREFNDASLAQLRSFCEPTYLHQVIARRDSNPAELQRFEDLPEAIEARENSQDNSDEWRIHFHIPLHAEPASPLLSTRDHLLETLDFAAQHPRLCQHFEMETYTWAVLPDSLHSGNVVDQITREYQWLLPELSKRKMTSQS